MRRIFRVIGSATAFGLFMVNPGSVIPQAHPSDLGGVVQQGLPDCALTQCLLAGAPVLDAPFTAAATTVWRPPVASGKAVMRATSRYYRDRAGRVRVEQGFVGQDAGPQRIILTPDPDRREAYVLDPVARTAFTVGRPTAETIVGGGGYYHFVLPLPDNRVISLIQAPANPDAGRTVGEASLGPRDMAGLRATGTRFTLRSPGGAEGSGRAERWVSPELRLVVSLRGEDPRIGVVEYDLTDISLAEPRLGLFEVPVGYAVGSPRGKFSWIEPQTWLER